MKLQLNSAWLVTLMLAGTANAATLTNVPSANPKTPGLAAPNIVSPELDLRLNATGSMKLDGATAITRFYGYINNGATSTMVAVLGNPNTPIVPISQASKTEPDKNTYLVLDGQTGADPDYNYGEHFLFQGHEAGAHGYITRINLDADGNHRVTLMADKMADGSVIANIDGSTWDPFTGKLLFTGEEGAASGVAEGVVLEATLDFPSTVTKLSGVIGHAGWEGVQADSDGNLWLVSDIGGSKGTVNTKARQPNSFIYRFVPKDKTKLSLGGKLQALQVMNLAGKAPIVFHNGQVDADILSQDMRDLHTYGNAFHTAWVTVHDTDVNGFAAFNAGDAAKVSQATPFKRPENGVFRAGFKQFFFTETGDTDRETQAGSAFGGFGGLFSLSQSSPSANTGVLKLFFLGDLAHTGLDNIAFFGGNQLIAVEDAGDALHTQRNFLDSAYLFDVSVDYSKAANKPVRIIAEGRDASATLDSGLTLLGDNEITGIHVSNGDPSVHGLLGAEAPTPFSQGWRVFWNQQHGDNNSWEMVLNKNKNDGR